MPVMRLRSLVAAMAACVLLAACDEAAEPDRAESGAPEASPESTTQDAAPVADPVQFRIVEFSDVGPTPEPTGDAWARFDRVDCDGAAVPRVPTPAEQPVVACSLEEESAPAIKYALGPAEIVGGVVDAEASVPEGQTDWVVSLQLDTEASDAFTRIGGRLVKTGGQVAIVLDGVVVSAPTMAGVITNGQVQIAGGFTAEEAQVLADQLEGAPIPG
jgi:hypothetical protein